MWIRFLLIAALFSLSSAASAEGLKKGWFRWDQGRFEMGPRISNLRLIDKDPQAERLMGGRGGYLRYRFNSHLGFEASMDILGSEEQAPGENAESGDVSRITVPMSTNLMFYLFPNWRFQVYFLGGFGLAGNSVRYGALGQESSFAMPFAQYGLGAQIRFDSFRLDFSVRDLIAHREGNGVELRPIEDDEGYTLKPVNYRPYTGDRDLKGAMFTLGIHWGMGRRDRD